MALKLLIDTSACFVMGQAYADALMAEPMPAGITRPSGAGAVRVQALGALEALLDDGRIRKVQYDAGREIKRYAALWRLQLGARVANYTGQVSGSIGSDPLVTRGLSDRYQAWAAWARKVRVKGEVTALELTWALVVDDQSCRELRLRYRMSNVRALRIIQTSLFEYGRLAGWEEADKKAA